MAADAVRPAGTIPDLLPTGSPSAASSTADTTARHRFSLHFDDPDHLDQVANTVRRDGWTAFERPLPEFVVAVAERWPGLFLDVGCNTGFYALLAALAHSRNRVLAFEPVPAIGAIAGRNAALNGVADRVHVVACAVSDRNGSAPLYIPPGDHGMVETSASLDRGFKSDHLRHDLVPVRRLDRALLLSRRHWNRVSAIKIDVEGHEAAVLAGAYWTVRLHRPIVFVEVLQHADLARLNAFAVRERYVSYALRPGRGAERATTVAFDPEAWNHGLVPREKAATFESLLS